MTNDIRTEVLTLSEIAQADMGFSIPSYQRPYVWPTEDVLKLFEDVKDAYLANEQHYFIGSVLSALDSNGCDYELIDGQQRMTTLMLVSLAFKAVGRDYPLAKVSIRGNQPRLQFSIRESVISLLGDKAGLKTYVAPSHEAVKQDPYLTNIDAALSVLQQSIKTLSQDNQFDLTEFADFVFTKVQWVNNIVPMELDLNRLFSNLNTTGIQLEPVDLLKAKLFKKITSDVVLYNAIWQACEHTENYFERNLRQLFKKADWNQLKYSDLHCFNRSTFAPAGEVADHGIKPNAAGLSILELAEQLETQKAPDNVVELTQEETDFDDETVYCRSIIGFELLLIHSLRIFYAQQGWHDVEPRIRASNLLLIFDSLLEKGEATIKAFIELLWRVRYQFDTWVVKWVEHDDRKDAQLRLTSQSRSKSNGKYYINRTPRELSALVQLQAVRNFTGDRSAHYWLTALLARLVSEPNMAESDVLRSLEKVDNALSMTIDTQKEASFTLALSRLPVCRKWSEQKTYFSEPLGTSFEHYWFQKLEYLLWKRGQSKNDDKLKKYRITSKNSVEHVHPQNEEYHSQLPLELLNAFGNLALLSPGENSSYSNQAVAKKKADFEAKPKYDSLKLKRIFKLHNKDGLWSADQIKQHQTDMISLLKKHYSDKE